MKRVTSGAKRLRGPHIRRSKWTALFRRLHDQGGFTVTEVLVSYVVLLSVSMVVLGSSLTAMNSVLHAKKTSQATQVANQQLEKARNLPFDNVGTQSPQGVPGNPPGSIVTPATVDGFDVTTRVRWMYDTGWRAYKSVTVTVSSTVGAVGVSTATIIYGRSYIVNAGDIRITVVDRDTRLPLPGAGVSVEESATGRSFNDTADESGQAIFSALPVGTYIPNATLDGYLPPQAGRPPA